MKVSIPSFGFDEMVNVSEQKDHQRYQFERNGGNPGVYQKRGSYQSGGAGFRGSRGGGFRGGRGGPRGGGQQNYIW